MSEQGTNQIQQLQVPPAQDFDTANFQGSMQEVLHENIGKYVLVDFLIGTSNLVTRQGFLYYVGTQFIVLYDSLNLRYVVCDIFSIKFVTFLLPGYQPGQIQTTAEFEMHPAEHAGRFRNDTGERRHVRQHGTRCRRSRVIRRAPRHDARAGCPRPCHPPEESDRAITILPHCHISIHTSHEWEVTILSKLLKN